MYCLTVGQTLAAFYLSFYGGGGGGVKTPPLPVQNWYTGTDELHLCKTSLRVVQVSEILKNFYFGGFYHVLTVLLCVVVTPGPPDKSQIWLEFNRRLELMGFFNRDNKNQNDPINNQSIIDFMKNNATDDSNPDDLQSLKNNEIQQQFRPKSGWRPSQPN